MSSDESDSFLFVDFLHPLSSDESYFLDCSDFGSSGTCAFPYCFDDSVGRVSGVGSSVFVPVLVGSNFDVVTLVVFVLMGVKSKGGGLIKIFWRPKSGFSL